MRDYLIAWANAIGMIVAMFTLVFGSMALGVWLQRLIA
jgi:hypothetical protein